MFCFHKRRRFGKIVYNEGGLGITVVHGGKRGKALLSGSVPYFEFYGAVREVRFLGQEGSWGVAYQPGSEMLSGGVANQAGFMILQSPSEEEDWMPAAGYYFHEAF